MRTLESIIDSGINNDYTEESYSLESIINSGLTGSGAEGEALRHGYTLENTLAYSQETFMDSVKEGIDKIIAWFKELAKKIWNWILSIGKWFSEMWNKFWTWVKGLKKADPKKVDEGLNAVEGKLKGQNSEETSKAVASALESSVEAIALESTGTDVEATIGEDCNEVEVTNNFLIEKLNAMFGFVSNIFKPSKNVDEKEVDTIIGVVKEIQEVANADESNSNIPAVKVKRQRKKKAVEVAQKVEEFKKAVEQPGKALSLLRKSFDSHNSIQEIDKVAKEVEKKSNNLKEIGKKVGDLANQATKALEEVKNGAKEGIDSSKKKAINFFQKGMTGIVSIFKKTSDSVQQSFHKVKNKIKSITAIERLAALEADVYLESDMV